MTNKEAVHDIKKSLKIDKSSGEIVMIKPLRPQTVDKIIKALEQEEPDDDCISRQAALEPYQTLDDSDVISVWMIRKNIKQIPPATPKPKTGQWIVNEQLGNNIQCSECGMLLGLNKEDIDEGHHKLPNYCDNCGTMNLMEIKE